MIPAPALFRSARADDNGFSPRPGFEPFDPVSAESTLGARFGEVALRCGSRIAVRDGETGISYAELLNRACAVAKDLRSRHGEGGGIVAICLSSSLAAIEAMLGTLLGGFGYFYLSPSLPEQQKAEQLKAAKPITLVGEDRVWCGQRASLNTRGPGGIAALYATSGSTGTPKLAAWSHRGILFDIGRQTNDLYLGPDDVFDSLFSFAFSASLATIFGALLNGAELHCHDPRPDLAALPGWFADRRITVSTMTVSMLRHVCLLRPPTRCFASMRLLSVGGEALRPADVTAFRSVFSPSCVLQNAMASTEARTYAQYFIPKSGPVENPVPIGWPVAEKEVLLLDENGDPVPAGSPGEIVVESRYLASGYVGDSDGTAAKFQTLPDGRARFRTGDRGLLRPDGSLVFLGRADAQAKIRGHRVELEDIARTIETHPAVRTAAVAVDEDRDGNNRLVAYVVLNEGRTASETGIREFLRGRLADYCLPAAVVLLPELPLNSNFKLDRGGLPPPLVQAPHAQASNALPLIEVLREMWKDVLQRRQVLDDERFSELGGDSLSAVRLLAAISERFQCDLPPDTLHRCPTLRLLAARVDQAVRGDASSAHLITFLASGEGSPIFFVGGMFGSAHGYERLATRMTSRPAYGLNTSSSLTAGPKLSVESIAAPLVTEIERIVPPGGNAVLVGYSFGGTVAFEIARQLRAKVQIEALPIVIDMTAMNAPGRPARTFRQQFLDVISNFLAWALYEAAHFDLQGFSARASGHLARIGRALGLLPPVQDFDPRIHLGSSKVPQSYQALLTAMYRALLRYVPGTYDGKVILLRTRVPTLFRTTDPMMGWQFVAGKGVEVHPIAGRHGDCMDEQHERDLAALLLQCARTFDGPASAIFRHGGVGFSEQAESPNRWRSRRNNPPTGAS